MTDNYLISFIHIPKCGGTTILHWMHRLCPGGFADLHFHFGEEIGIEKRPWVAGHVRRARVAMLCEAMDRPVRHFTTLRHPVGRLISDLNFMLYKPELGLTGRSAKSDHEVQMVAGTDFQSIASVRRLLEGFSPDAYTKFADLMLERDWTARRPSDDFIDRGLRGFHHIGSHDRPETTLAAMGLLRPGAVIPPEQAQQNARPYRFDPAIFAEPAIADYLAERAELDIRIYGRALLRIG